MKISLATIAILAAAAALPLFGQQAKAATADSIMGAAKLARCKTVLVCTNPSRYRPYSYNKYRPRGGVTVNRRCVRQTQCPR